MCVHFHPFHIIILAKFRTRVVSGILFITRGYQLMIIEWRNKSLCAWIFRSNQCISFSFQCWFFFIFFLLTLSCMKYLPTSSRLNFDSQFKIQIVPVLSLSLLSYFLLMARWCLHLGQFCMVFEINLSFRTFYYYLSIFYVVKILHFSLLFYLILNKKENIEQEWKSKEEKQVIVNGKNCIW